MSSTNFFLKCGARAFVTKAAHLVRPQEKLLAISESLNILPNSFAACSLLKKERLCLATKSAQRASASITFGELWAQKKVDTVLEEDDAAAISLCLVVPICLATSFLPPWDMLTSVPQILHLAYVLPVQLKFLL